MYIQIITNWRNPASNNTMYKLVELTTPDFIMLCDQLNNMPVGPGLRYTIHPLKHMFRKITLDEMRYISYKVQDLTKLSSSSSVYLLSIVLNISPCSPHLCKDADILKECIEKTLCERGTLSKPKHILPLTISQTPHRNHQNTLTQTISAL
jgi:hypothetical protein